MTASCAARRTLAGPVLLICLALSACSGTAIRPDLARLYGASRAATDQPPVVLIHGVLGARLREGSDGVETWPGSVRRLLFDNYEHLALEIDPDSLLPGPSSMQAYRIFDRAAGTDFYGRIIDTLTDAGGYRVAIPGQPPPAGTRLLYVFVYDWRQDNVSNARRLDDLLEQVRLDLGNPEQMVDIVAHSMGGLLTRYFLRYGRQDVLDDNEFPVNLWGASRVRRVVLLGTPNLGSVNAVRSFLEGFKLGFGRIPTEVLATMPSTYQLFPHPLAGPWLITQHGRPLERDLYSPRLWQRFQWSVYDPEVIQRVVSRFDDPARGRAYVNTLQAYFDKHLERARRFVWSLTVPLAETPWQLILFGGDCELTPARILVEEIDGQSVIRLDPGKVADRMSGVDYASAMLEPGDGTVTKASLLARDSLDPAVPRHPYIFFPLDYSMFICEAHDQLTGNITFQDNLLHVLLSR